MKRIVYVLILFLSNAMLFSQTNNVEFSHYIFPEFTQGVILMKTGVKNKVLLNYNSLTEEMVFEDRGRRLAIGEAVLEQIDTVFINDRKFFRLNDNFVERVYHSKYDLYAEHKCKLNSPGKPAGYGTTSETSAISSYSSLMADGRFYELKLPDDYTASPFIVYWLKKNGELNKFMNIRQLGKLFEDKEDLFKAYIKEHDVTYDDQESVVQLINYLEAN